MIQVNGRQLTYFVDQVCILQSPHQTILIGWQLSAPPPSSPLEEISASGWRDIVNDVVILYVFSFQRPLRELSLNIIKMNYCYAWIECSSIWEMGG